MSLTYHGPPMENNACKGPHRGEAIFYMPMDGTGIHLAAELLGGQQIVPNNAHIVGNMVNATVSRGERWASYVLRRVAT